MKNRYQFFVLLTAASLALASCEKQDLVDTASKDKQIDPSKIRYQPTTPNEIKLVENLGKVTIVFKELYKEKSNLNVVNAAINARVYTDESILLKDLIYPEGSLLAKSTRFQRYAQKGALSLSGFATNFWAAANKLNDPEFTAFLNSLKTRPLEKGASSRGTATTQIGDEVTVYFPYSQQFMVPYEEEGGGGGYSYGPVTSIVTATADADSGWGTQPYTDSYGVTQYQSVLVDDAYAEANPTHIIGLNGVEPYVEPTTSNATLFPPTGPITLPNAPARGITQVYVGDVRCIYQFDNLISLTGNGGGSEIVFTRADGFLKIADGQVQADVFSTPKKEISRSDIKRKNWVTFYQEWDSDWEVANLNENLAVFEDDNRNEFKLTGSLGTSLTLSTGNTVTGTIGFEKVFKGDDALERQHNLVRASFIALNRIDLEGEMRNEWPVRDKTARISYTLWDRTFTR